MSDDQTTPGSATRRRRRHYYPGPAANRATIALAEANGAGHEDDAIDPTVATETEAMTPGRAEGAPTVDEDGASIAADRVQVTRAAVGRVESADLSVHQGAVGIARSGRISIDRGALGAALANEIEVERGIARTVVAREVELEQAIARTVIAGEVQARQSIIGFLIARRVEGDARVLFDWRGALAFGAAAGLIAGLVGRVRRRGGKA